MGQVSFTTAEIEKLLDGRYNTFRQDVSDVASQTITNSNTEYKLTNDGSTRNDVTAPAYITSRWDTTNDKIAFPEELDHPTYVGDISFTFTPDTASSGVGVLRLYIDDSGTQNFAADPVIRTYTFDYKGAVSVNVITTWYLGTEVYYTVEFDDSGAVTNKGAVIYRT
jgi:hypothetical protein